MTEIAEKTMTFDELIAIATAMVQERRVQEQLSVASKRAPEWLQGLKQKEKRMAEHDATAQQAEDKVATLTAQVPALEKTVQRLQKEVANWKHDLAEKKKIEEQELAQVRVAIDVAKKELADLNQERESFKARVTQLVG